MRLSLFLLSPTLLTSFLVRPDEQVAQKYVLGRLFAWFEDVSSLLLLSPSNRLVNTKNFPAGMFSAFDSCKYYTRHGRIARSTLTSSPTRANMLGICYYGLIISWDSCCFQCQAT